MSATFARARAERPAKSLVYKIQNIASAQAPLQENPTISAS